MLELTLLWWTLSSILMSSLKNKLLDILILIISLSAGFYRECDITFVKQTERRALRWPFPHRTGCPWTWNVYLVPHSCSWCRLNMAHLDSLQLEWPEWRQMVRMGDIYWTWFQPLNSRHISNPQRWCTCLSLEKASSQSLNLKSVSPQRQQDRTAKLKPSVAQNSSAQFWLHSKHEGHIYFKNLPPQVILNWSSASFILHKCC